MMPEEPEVAAPTRQEDAAPPDEDPDLHPEGPVAYTVRLDTTAGQIDIVVRPDWAPRGAIRFLHLAASGDLDDLAFYRSVRGCLVQFGLPTRRQWPPVLDDPHVGVPFLLGAVCFAAVGSDSRKSTVFICSGDMSTSFGCQSWETPIGAVAERSLHTLDHIETAYGDIAECYGNGPRTDRIVTDGNEYLKRCFPLLTWIRSAKPLDWPPKGRSLPVFPPLVLSSRVAESASGELAVAKSPPVGPCGKPVPRPALVPQSDEKGAQEPKRCPKVMSTCNVAEPLNLDARRHPDVPRGSPLHSAAACAGSDGRPLRLGKYPPAPPHRPIRAADFAPSSVTKQCDARHKQDYHQFPPEEQHSAPEPYVDAQQSPASGHGRTLQTQQHGPPFSCEFPTQRLPPPMPLSGLHAGVPMALWRQN